MFVAGSISIRGLTLLSRACARACVRDYVRLMPYKNWMAIARATDWKNLSQLQPGTPEHALNISLQSTVNVTHHLARDVG